MIHRSHAWVVLLALAAAAAAEWLRRPGFLWIGLAAAGILLTLLALRHPRRPADWLLLALLLLLGAVAGLGERSLHAIDNDWPAVRESRVSRAFQLLSSELGRVQELADNAAEAGVHAAGADQADAFEDLAGAIPAGPLEIGLAVFDSLGDPWAWAGSQRLLPQPSGAPVSLHWTRYYAMLEVRRPAAGGDTVVASVLLWAHPAVPDRSGSLAESFRQRSGVDLVFCPPARSCQGPDVFDYKADTTAAAPIIFSVQPRPPEQGTAKEQALRRTTLAVELMLAAVLLAAFVRASRSPLERWVLLLLTLWLVVRTPPGLHGAGLFFSKATFFRPVLGPFSSSAGALALTGALAVIAGVWLWRLRLRRRWYTVALGVALLLLAPYLMRELGRGITPPSIGVSMGLWIGWQLTLLLPSAALIVLAAAFFRGDRRPAASGTPWTVYAGVAIAIGASVAGLVVWEPRFGWPPWYTFLWTPALFLVTLPARHRSVIAGIAVVAGCAAALITWGAVIEGRLQVARRDVAMLGTEPDPLAMAALQRFGERMRTEPPPGSETELYVRWRSSRLGAEDYPARLGLWTSGGQPLLELRLDSLDLPAPLVSTLIRNLAPGDSQEVVALPRVPGIHLLLIERLTPDLVLTTGVGPASRLLVPDRLGRLLRETGPPHPLYTLSLLLPRPDDHDAGERIRWRRAPDWTVRGERLLDLPGGVRHVHAQVDLRGPAPILVRGTLVVLLDVAFLALLWFASELLDGERAPRWSWRRFLRSYQGRLTVVLSLFFVLPAIGFAAWGFVRLRNEAQRGRDLLITQTLRDAVLAAGGLLQGPPTRLRDGLAQLSQNIDAELALYQGGVMASVSDPLLRDLGLLSPLMNPAAYEMLALQDEQSVTREGPLDAPPLRVGYRVVLPGQPAAIGVLATPQPAVDPALGQQELDLGLVLLLATLLGLGAAVGGAQAAARALSRPVAELRRSATALGRGEVVEPPAQGYPVEFEDVFRAFYRMASDVQASRVALEEARRRTAAVLATVATGVVALDGGRRVLLANPRAGEMLGRALAPGDRLDLQLGPEWRTLLEVVASPWPEGQTGRTAELDVQGRRIGVELARLEPELSGVVIALNDLTEVSRAERVLAWGEMARQVAHEIKNPLTPLRLGMQHLRRVYRDRRPQFDQALEETSGRILAEIDRLDTIARVFSRFGAPAEAAGPLERLDLAAVTREVVQLYQLAGEGTTVTLEAPAAVPGVARRDEVKEVLVNLLENARNAGARQIRVRVLPDRIEVQDDGQGIPVDQLERLFEPRFSTTTSGAGLGLPIVRRLVESWGGEVDVESEPERGTTVTIRFGALP